MSPVGHRGPDVARAERRLERPPEPVQGLDDQVAPALVGRPELVEVLRWALERGDRGALDRGELPAVEVGLHDAERADRLGRARRPADPPAGHVVELRRRAELERDVLRARRLQGRGRHVPVERDLAVRGVVQQDQVVLARERGRRLERREARPRRPSGCSGSSARSPSCARSPAPRRDRAGSPRPRASGARPACRRRAASTPRTPGTRGRGSAPRRPGRRTRTRCARSPPSSRSSP